MKVVNIKEFIKYVKMLTIVRGMNLVFRQAF
ncbi:hypothetical protein ERE_34080 [Agathobacter rectalis M104/1]|nr:hypothetical protein ERE_34080 [Agathobacter rectalis M104/1]